MTKESGNVLISCVRCNHSYGLHRPRIRKSGPDAYGNYTAALSQQQCELAGCHCPGFLAAPDCLQCGHPKHTHDAFGCVVCQNKQTACRGYQEVPSPADEQYIEQHLLLLNLRRERDALAAKLTEVTKLYDLMTTHRHEATVRIIAIQEALVAERMAHFGSVLASMAYLEWTKQVTGLQIDPVALYRILESRRDAAIARARVWKRLAVRKRRVIRDMDVEIKGAMDDYDRAVARAEAAEADKEAYRLELHARTEQLNLAHRKRELAEAVSAAIRSALLDARDTLRCATPSESKLGATFNHIGTALASNAGQALLERLRLQGDVVNAARELPEEINEVLSLHVQDQNDIQFVSDHVMELAERRLKLEETLAALDVAKP